MTTIWNDLVAAGAELVLNGHTHSYERFGEMDAAGVKTPNGVREIVVGTGGEDFHGFGTIKDASEARDSSTFGVLSLTLRPNGYDWHFNPIAGSTFTDSGTGSCH